MRFLASNNQMYFYHPDHLGSASFVTNTDSKAEQHIQYLPYGELFVSQSLNGYDARYKFTGKERDEETGLDYFGARYYDSDLSLWLSVDPMSDKYPSLSPYNYCAWNPLVLVDPDGNDLGWYKDENGYTQYDPKINSQKDLTEAGIKGNYKGQTVLGTAPDGHIVFGDEHGNITYSLPEILVDGGKMTEHARVMSNPIVKAVHKGQADFIEGGAEFTAATFNGVGNGATYVGTGLMIIPGGQPLGGALIGIGSASSAIGTGINMGLNAANGEWGQFANNATSLVFSYGLGKVINKLNLTNRQADFLKGFSSSQISIFNNIINTGIEIRKEKK